MSTQKEKLSLCGIILSGMGLVTITEEHEVD